jgi:hypothetical protein
MPKLKAISLKKKRKFYFRLLHFDLRVLQVKKYLKKNLTANLYWRLYFHEIYILIRIHLVSLNHLRI